MVEQDRLHSPSVVIIQPEEGAQHRNRVGGELRLEELKDCRIVCSMTSSLSPVMPKRRQRFRSAILAIGTPRYAFLILMLLLRTV